MTSKAEIVEIIKANEEELLEMYLFQINDSVTRNNFKLDIKALINDTNWVLICDEQNNSPSTIDNGMFILDGINVVTTETFNINLHHGVKFGE
jgi:hypothetical protein